MPTYEYRCVECATDLEVLVLTPAETPETCECGGQLRRRYTRVAARFVGWGFSKTDGLLPDRPGRRDFKTISDKASELFD
ncbi:MAG TPA: FmdB family zinc ribbon protein [Actinomycetota bacterium]|nr:FmdB family zinc ribbon protein [Actinomycetota bacterium]